MATNTNISDIKSNESNDTFIARKLDFEPADIFDEDIELEESNSNELLLSTTLSTENHTYDSKPDKDSIKMFVGQIPSSYTESDLLIMFEKFGKVYELRLLKDKITGKSKGCCFVTFFTRRAALNAQNALHNIKVLPGMHHPIQMKPADSENRNDRKLFVGMLPWKYSESDVRTLFSPYGTIEECTILRHPNGQSKGCAFVTYMTRQNARDAVESMHQCHTFEGCPLPIVVKFADTQKDKKMRRTFLLKNNFCEQNTISSFLQQRSLDIITACVVNNNLIQHLLRSGLIDMNSQSCDSNINQLKMLIAQLTKPASLQTNEDLINHLLTDHNGVNDSTALRYHLKQFDEETELEQLTQNISRNIVKNYFNCSELQGTTYQRDNPANSQNQIEGPDGANLFVYHIPQEFTDKHLADLFRPYGRIISAKVFTDQITKMGKSFGFVSYARADSARAAIQSLNGYWILGKKLKVELKKCKLISRY